MADGKGGEEVKRAKEEEERLTEELNKLAKEEEALIEKVNTTTGVKKVPLEAELDQLRNKIKELSDKLNAASRERERKEAEHRAEIERSVKEEKKRREEKAAEEARLAKEAEDEKKRIADEEAKKQKDAAASDHAVPKVDLINTATADSFIEAFFPTLSSRLDDLMDANELKMDELTADQRSILYMWALNCAVNGPRGAAAKVSLLIPVHVNGATEFKRTDVKLREVLPPRTSLVGVRQLVLKFSALIWSDARYMKLRKTSYNAGKGRAMTKEDLEHSSR
mgnify:CR=1 FL=1